MDAALTFGILWLDVCRAAQAGKLVVEGLKLFVPAGCSALVRERMAHLNRAAAKWELFELEERAEELKQIEILDRGNISTRLVHCPNDVDVQERFAGPIALVRSMMPEAEVGSAVWGGNFVSLSWAGDSTGALVGSSFWRIRKISQRPGAGIWFWSGARSSE